MVKTILTESGFIEGQTFKECRFLKAPTVTYAVYLDSYTRRGADSKNMISEHSYTIELYSYVPDPGAEARIEQSLDNRGIYFDKEARYWIQDEQIYQVIYTFDYIQK